MSKKSYQEREQQEAAAELRKLIKPGSTVYTVLRNVSSSGMSRVIDLLIVIPDYRDIYPEGPDGRRDYSAKPKRKLVGHKIRSIGWTAAKAMDDRWDNDRGGIKVGGCGMDMGFHLVYNLGRTLWPKGYKCPGKLTCRGNDHVNPGEQRDDYSRKHHHRDAGYALEQRWL
jgi:hypothetical protein